MSDDTETTGKSGDLPTENPEFVEALDDVLSAHISDLTTPNRAERRRRARSFRRVTVRFDAGIKRLYHPMLRNRLMPWGVLELRRRRRRARAAKVARCANRRRQ